MSKNYGVKIKYMAKVRPMLLMNIIGKIWTKSYRSHVIPKGIEYAHNFRIQLIVVLHKMKI